MQHSLICRAIAGQWLMEFDYEGLSRVVAPYCHGTSGGGAELLRAVQVRGASRSQGLGFGKLWRVEKIENARVLHESFRADDPDYNPRDRAMNTVHCCVTRLPSPSARSEG